MIFKRRAFIIVYLALSALNPSSTRAASNFAELTATAERITPHSTTVNRQQSVLSSIARSKSESNPPLLKRSLNSAETNLAVVGDSSNSKSLKKSDLYWALGAMALTSSISLFLIWLLFKKPSSSEEIDIAVTKSSSESVGEAAIDNSLAVDREIAASALDSEADKFAFSQQSHSPTADLDAVRAIQDWQSEVDSSHHLSNPDTVARITRRREAIWESIETGDFRSIEPLLKIMPYVEEPDKSLIITAVTRIIHRSFKPIDEQLFTNLQDANPEVRLNAVRDLRNLYQFVTPVITKISQMQSDTDYEVRQTAIQALGQFNANPFPTFSKADRTTEQKTDNLVSGEESEANLHLVAYLLAELDAEK